MQKLKKFTSIASMPIVFSRLTKLVAAVLATVLFIVWNYKMPISAGIISLNSAIDNSILNRSTAVGTSPLVELPDQNDTESRAFLRHLFKTGTFLELAKTVEPRNREKVNSTATLLSEYYPDRLSLQGHIFWTTDGRELSAYRIFTAIHNSSSKLLPIPNVVHFFMFYPNQHVQLQFYNFLAILSAVWLSGADKVILWCSATPDGHYWRQLKQNLTTHGKQNRLLLATRPLPNRVFNHAVNIIEHRVDVMKLETAILLGGIILDTDVLTLRSLQPLRSYDCVIGRESSVGLTIGAFMSKPRAVFLLLWYMLYQTFDDSQWAHHSVLMPNNIWRKFPNLCRVENESIARPGWSDSELKILYGDHNISTKTSEWNWHNNYMLHLWRPYRPEVNETSVRRLNSMFGQVVRFILYGTEQLM